MKKAFYMKFKRGNCGTLDKTGGKPTHTPPVSPKCNICGDEMAFLVQFYNKYERLDLKDLMAIHLYQCRNVEEGCDPKIVLVRLPKDSSENHLKQGVTALDVVPYDIEWEKRYDPDEIPVNPPMGDETLQSFYSSKAGGTMPFKDALPLGSECIIQLTEYPANFNFSGLVLAIFYDNNGEMQVSLV